MQVVKYTQNTINRTPYANISDPSVRVIIMKTYLLVRMISIFDFFLILTSTPKERQFPIIPIIPTIVVRYPPTKTLNFSKFMLQPSFLQ